MVAIDTLRVGVFGSDFSFPGQGKRSGGAVIAARGRRRDDLPSVIALLASRGVAFSFVPGEEPERGEPAWWPSHLFVLGYTVEALENLVDEALSDSDAESDIGYAKSLKELYADSIDEMERAEDLVDLTR